MLVIECPYCGEKLNVPGEYVGKSGICNKCRNKFLVKNPENNNIPTIKQIEFLKELGIEEIPKTKKEASILIEKEKQKIYKSEYMEREKIYNFIETIFPLFNNIDLDIELPFKIEEIICQTLLSSSLVSDIKENKNTSIKKIREILEPILGKTVFNFINRRSEESILDFEIDWNDSYSYLIDFLEYYDITVDSEESFLFNLWTNNFGKRMSNSKGFKPNSSLSNDIIKYIQKVMNDKKEEVELDMEK